MPDPLREKKTLERAQSSQDVKQHYKNMQELIYYLGLVIA